MKKEQVSEASCLILGLVQVTHPARCCGFTHMSTFDIFWHCCNYIRQIQSPVLLLYFSYYILTLVFLVNVCSDMDKRSVITRGNSGRLFSHGCFSFPVRWNTQAPKHDFHVWSDTIAVKCKHGSFSCIPRANQPIPKTSQVQNSALIGSFLFYITILYHYVSTSCLKVMSPETFSDIPYNVCLWL